MTEQFTLPLARRGDPATSHEAARRVTRRAAPTEAAILNAFRVFGPMTDDELVAKLPGKDSTLKTARSRITIERGLLEDSGEKRDSTAGVPMIVWRVSP